MIRKIFGFVLLVLLLVCLWQYKLLVYGLAQARGQIHILANTRPVDEVIQDPSTPDSTREKLIFIQEVRRFAVDALGINDSKNYTTFYDQGGKPSLWVVTAAEPFALKAKEWGFPLLGSFPYKGFFEREMALEEIEKLKAEDWDTYLGVVSGWSTLGWFKDPILSNMLLRSKGELADLIIHELTHGTLFVKDSIEFNENLATFIGNQGAKQFLAVKFGLDSEEYLQYIHSNKDKETFSNHILRGSDRLDSLYGTFTPEDSKAYKLREKKAMINEIFEQVDTLLLYRPERYAAIYRSINPNNAYFMSYIRYNSKLDYFERELAQRFHYDLRLYLEYLKAQYPSL